MGYINYIIIGVLLFFVLQRILPVRGVRQISAADLKKEITSKNKQFVDVRTPSEFTGNHIKGFKNIPLHLLTKKADQKLSKENEVIIICQSGMRSQKASKILKKLGFTKVANVKGGISSWVP